jgi:branched-chain amino acid aminotransferase
MSRGPLALLNGRMIPAAELTIPVYDAGFVLGATVSEQLRTFAGKIYKLDEHLARLRRGLEITEIDAGCTVEQLAAWANELVAANHKLLDPADDLGVSIFVTPGPYATLAPPDVPRTPTIGISTFPLPFHLWAEKYESGELLVISEVLQLWPGSWPADLKCRSRMHYYLADKEVSKRYPGARALLEDAYGYISETATSNVAYVKQSNDLATRHRSDVLPGISLATIIDLSQRLEISFNEEWPTRLALTEAMEVLITSTPFCMLPVVRIDDAPILDGRPGPVYRKLLDAWSGDVGVDIAAQARQFAKRG